MRLDKYLSEEFGSRSKAAAAIERGVVKVNGIVRAPSYEVKESDNVEISAEEISLECRIPIRLVHQVLYQLQEIQVLYEITPEDNKSHTAAYLPALDINQLNVALLLDRLDTYGSEDFKIDRDKEFRDQWMALVQAREEYYRSSSKILLKDL